MRKTKAENTFTKELSELENSEYFRRFLRKKKKEDIIKGFDEVVGKVKKRKVEDWDSF